MQNMTKNWEEVMLVICAASYVLTFRLSACEVHACKPNKEDRDKYTLQEYQWTFDGPNYKRRLSHCLHLAIQHQGDSNSCPPLLLTNTFHEVEHLACRLDMEQGLHRRLWSGL